MSRSYYYFVSSLPLLNFDALPPLSYEKFLDDCQRLLNQEDYELVLSARLNDEVFSSTITNAAFLRYRNFHHDLHNAIAHFRAIRAHREPNDYLRGVPLVEPFLLEAVHQAAKLPNPWEAEKFLDEVIWKFLDDLVQGHHFDSEYLLVYGLKLQILERHQQRTSSKGKEVLKEYEQSAVLAASRER